MNTPIEPMNKSSVVSPLLIAVVIGGGLYVLGQYVGSQPQRIQQESEANRQIEVQGSATIEARPDVAKLTLGVQTGPQSTAEAALRILEQRFSNVVESISSAGVNEEDIRTTNLSINPVYDFAEGRQTLRGFEASESVEVTIRDLTQVGEVLTRATGEGVNQAGGITFSSENEEMIQTEAEQEAIKDARQKAEMLADALGVRLGDVKSFNASSQKGGQPIPFAADAAAVAERSQLPVPSGTQEVQANVTVTYEIK